MTKICIFDLDGTLLDTIKTIKHYGDLALKEFGIEEIPEERYKLIVGTGIKNVIKGMLEYRGCYNEELFSKVFKVYDDAYNANTFYKTEIYSGIKETLKELKAKGIKIAIVSNKPDFAAKEVVEYFFGKDYFDYVTGQKPNGPLKPDPQEVLNIISTYNLEKGECIYIGDTGTDMKTGKNAGLYTVGVLWGFRKRDELTENGADTIISTPEELLGIIDF